jgi:hypothetical protein
MGESEQCRRDVRRHIRAAPAAGPAARTPSPSADAPDGGAVDVGGSSTAVTDADDGGDDSDDVQR